MSCSKIGEFCKTPGEKVLLRIPLNGSSFIKLFTPNEILGTGDFRRPKKPNGFEYEATVGGQCAKSEPEWPEVVGETVTCGSVTFTCRAISNNSLARIISTCAWSVSAGGTITFSGEGLTNTNGEQEVFAYANGGAVEETGEVTARMTFGDGSIEDAILSYHVD